LLLELSCFILPRSLYTHIPNFISPILHTLSLPPPYFWVDQAEVFFSFGSFQAIEIPAHNYTVLFSPSGFPVVFKNCLKPPDNKELFEAVRRGDAQKVQTWLLSRRNRRPRTPLNFLRTSTSHSAWLCSIVDPLNGYTVLHLAALLGHKEVVKILLNVDSQMARIKDRRGCFPIHLAAWNGHVEVIQTLINAEPNTVDAVNNAKESPLHLSAQHGHGKVVAVLLANHADARMRNARAETALDVAARFGKANVCRLLICNCPELALQSASECITTDPGRSRHLAQVVYPLHAAARHGHIDCLQILCHSGFDLDYVTEEGSALHVAALFGKVEAVKLLLEQGINVDTRDGQGRTVLETLAEHENEKASDLTQVIQSREGWSECRKLIEAYIHKYKDRESDRISAANHSIYLNLPFCSKYGANPKDVIWKPIPRLSTARLQSSRNHVQHSSSYGPDATLDISTCCPPPSIVTKMVALVNVEHNQDDISILPLSTVHVESSGSESGSQPSPSQVEDFGVENRVPRFTVIVPNHRYQHTLQKNQKNGILLPRMGVRTSLNSDSVVMCPSPLSYDAWQSQHAGPYDNVISPRHPLLGYDNVPQNPVVYDNAPPPGHRCWQHFCELKSIHKSGCENVDAPSCSIRSDDIQTIPPVKPNRQRLSVLEKTLKPEPTPRKSKAHEASTIKNSGSVKYRPPSSSSLRTESPASIITFACSTLERSLSPGEQSSSVPSGTVSLNQGRAPLALPEEVSMSASASILSVQNSPERYFMEEVSLRMQLILLNCIEKSLSITHHYTKRRRHSRLLNDDYFVLDHSPVTIFNSGCSVKVIFNECETASASCAESITGENENEANTDNGHSELDHLPSPETTESRIHHFLCSQDNVKQRLSQSPSVSKRSQHTQKDAMSPSSTVESDCTLASSCSLPIISHVSSTPPSVVSPSQEHSHPYKQSSMDDQSFSSAEVRFRTASSVPTHGSINKEMCGLSISSDGDHQRGEINNTIQTSFAQSDKVSTRRSSLDESIEWKKKICCQISEIMESFGGAICRESVFAAHYEPKVAVYLRDRRSQALMLQLNGPQAVQNRQSFGFDADKRYKQPVGTERGVNAVAEWLNVCVGIPNPRANEIAEILESNGFDSINHMVCFCSDKQGDLCCAVYIDDCYLQQSTLDRVSMQEIGLDKSTQHQIGMYLENYPNVSVPSANSFTYVSDWLHSLDLEDYLGHFISGGLTSMLIVFAVDSTRKHLKVNGLLTILGITKLGHQKRILNSLKKAKEERRQRAAERAAVAQEEEVDSGQESRSTMQSSSSTQIPHSVVVGGHPTEWQHSSNTLVESCISYSAHYLGSMEISNVEETEDSRRAMIKLKRGIREIAKVPHVLLEISVSGVRVLDAVTKQLTVEHEIAQIQIVCQDERDLNCFAYISQDGDRHFCHVFCVLTADVATEIIVTLGQAFEVCYRITNDSYGSTEPIAI
uniref:ANK_REP_REGION domain-containing protein n=1 Tax=Brugia pahangi TaxID=6280 RepID=A0A0N4T0F4_BRUPA